MYLLDNMVNGKYDAERVSEAVTKCAKYMADKDNATESMKEIKVNGYCFYPDTKEIWSLFEDTYGTRNLLFDDGDMRKESGDLVSKQLKVTVEKLVQAMFDKNKNLGFKGNEIRKRFNLFVDTIVEKIEGCFETKKEASRFLSNVPTAVKELCENGFHHIIENHAELNVKKGYRADAEKTEKRHQEEITKVREQEKAKYDEKEENLRKQLLDQDKKLSMLMNKVFGETSKGGFESETQPEPEPRAALEVGPAFQPQAQLEAESQPEVEPASESVSTPTLRSKKRKQPESEVEPKRITESRPVTEEVQTNRPIPKKKTKRRKTNWTTSKKK